MIPGLVHLQGQDLLDIHLYVCTCKNKFLWCESYKAKAFFWDQTYWYFSNFLRKTCVQDTHYVSPLQLREMYCFWYGHLSSVYLSQNCFCPVTWKPFKKFWPNFTEMFTAMRGECRTQEQLLWFTYFWSYGPLNIVNSDFGHKVMSAP